MAIVRTNIKHCIRHSTLVRAGREKVFDCLTTAEGLNGWFTTGAVVEPCPGGEIRFRWTDWGPDHFTGEDGGAILEFIRPERFAFQWSPDRPDYATTVEIDFETAAEGTIIRLKEAGYRDTPEGLEKMLDCAAGWGEALTLLKFYLEHGIRY